MLTRRAVLKSTLALTALACSGRSRAADDLFYWDNHSGFGYSGPQDIALLDHWRAAGINYLSINVGYDAVPWSTTLRAIADYTRVIESRSDMVICANYAEIWQAHRAGKMALTFDIEGMGSLNGDIALVELYYRLGVRQMLIAYNLNNDAGGGCHDVDQGLTDFGRAVIIEMNRVGMVVDCAHSGIKSGLEAMKLSSKPCIFSHANVRALHDHERNITDAQIKAVAATGGVIGVNGLNLFLGDGPATIDGMAAHIDYIARLVGVAHVGIGLDADPSDGPALEQEVATKYWPTRQYPPGRKISILPPGILPELAGRLRAMGYQEADVQAVMAGNFMRIASQVWAA